MNTPQYLHELDPAKDRHRIVVRTPTCAVLHTGQWSLWKDIARVEVGFNSGWVLAVTSAQLGMRKGQFYLLRALPQSGG